MELLELLHRKTRINVGAQGAPGGIEPAAIARTVVVEGIVKVEKNGSESHGGRHPFMRASS